MCICVDSAGGLDRAPCYTWKRIQSFCLETVCQFGDLARVEVALEVQNDWSD